MNSISVKGVTKVYQLYDKPIDRLKEAMSIRKKNYHKDFFALDEVSFDVEKGQTVGIIGTNGSGKSTILKIITGVLSPTKGTVEVNGKISALLELGAGFNSEYTGIENIYMNGTMMGYTKEEMDAKLPEILEFADIGDFVYQPVKTYSSGMFVRLAFALAINVEPEILIVDEALSVGDVFFQAKCFRKMDEIRKKGTTVLMVTHDMGSVIKYCEKVVLLNRGHFVAEGSAGEMVDLYKKILANQLDDETDNNQLDKKNEQRKLDVTGNWKEKLGLNAETIEYGDKKAEIIDFGIFDHNDEITNIITKGEKFSIRMKVKFHEAQKNPIFAFTFKDKKGTEITGTNSMLEDCKPVEAKPGQIYEITFSQKAIMQGGEYLLSLGCTTYKGEELSINHRLYDVTYLTVLSEINTIGYFDIGSKASIACLNED